MIQLNKVTSNFTQTLAPIENVNYEALFYRNNSSLLSYCICTSEKNPAITKYIEEQKEFIGLNDYNNIPDSIKPYLNSIKDYMVNHNMDIKDYWIWTSYVQEDSGSIYIPICHYDGFVFKKDLEEKNIDANKDRNEGEPITVIDFNGNASGKDGHLEIEKSTKQVLSYKLWQ